MRNKWTNTYTTSPSSSSSSRRIHIEKDKLPRETRRRVRQHQLRHSFRRININLSKAYTQNIINNSHFLIYVLFTYYFSMTYSIYNMDFYSNWVYIYVGLGVRCCCVLAKRWAVKKVFFFCVDHSTTTDMCQSVDDVRREVNIWFNRLKNLKYRYVYIYT